MLSWLHRLQAVAERDATIAALQAELQGLKKAAGGGQVGAGKLDRGARRALALDQKLRWGARKLEQWVPAWERELATPIQGYFCLPLLPGA